MDTFLQPPALPKHVRFCTCGLVIQQSRGNLRTSSLSLAAERIDSLLEESLIVNSEEEARVVGEGLIFIKKQRT